MTKVRGAVRWLSPRSMPSILAASLLAVGVLVVGPRLLGRPPTPRFLLWNLALAWIPYLAALALDALHATRRRTAMISCAAVWLLFLPNAPYLVSDLSHLHHASATPWLDLARYVAFAWAGCLLAVGSLRIVHRLVARQAGLAVGFVVVVVAAGLSGFGVALGRFARLNSWELLTRPTVVAAEAIQLAGSRQAIAVAGFFTLLLLVLYAAFEGAGRTAANGLARTGHT